MRRISLFIALIICVQTIAFNQVPETFSYQAIARDQQGSPLADQMLTVRIGILQDGGLIWQEDHEVTTSDRGLFTLNIGDPDALNPIGSAGSFSEIPWGVGFFGILVSVDAGSGFEELGTSEFHAVPFALYAADGPGGTGPQGPQGEPGPVGPPGADEQELGLDGSTLSITGGNSVDLTPAIGSGSEWDGDGDTISTFNHVAIGTTNPNQSTLAVQGFNLHPEAPLFEVRREDGFPVFAVYSDGVQVYVDEDSKSVKGGFAVGGYSRNSKGIQQEYLTVSPDSVRIYVPETDQAKGVRGGFAVGGYSRNAKGPAQEYLAVTPDSVRIYVPETAQAKGVRGGFAVGGYSRNSKGYGQDFLFVNPDSTRVYVPNKANDPGIIGLQGGFAVTGYTEGAKAPPDYLMGINRGITRFNTSDNDRGFAIGSQGEGWGSNFLELTPTNAFIGTDAGLNNQELDPDDESGWGLSSMNVFVGYQSGMLNEYGHHNTFLGFCAGTNTLGDWGEPDFAAHNAFIGTQSGFKNTQGSYNAYLGCYTGFENLDGTANVFIGGNAGYSGIHTSAATMVGNNAGTYYNGDGGVTFLGYYAGFNSQGDNNTYLGYHAGSSSEDGFDNIAIGRRSGQYMTGDRNVIIGNDAGRGSGGSSDFEDNTVVGHMSGSYLTTGNYNSFFGSFSGQSVNDGDYNATFGAGSGSALSTGDGNTFMGADAGYSATTSSYNVMLGHDAGYSNTTGNGNTLLGTYAGFMNTGGAGNVFIGNAAGYNEYGSDQLYIDNSSTVDPLIWGDFASDYVIMYADVDVYSLYEFSDRNMKTNIKPLSNSLDKVMAMNGVSFDWIRGNRAKGAAPEQDHSIGVIAQEVENVFPSLVHETRNGVKTVKYSGLIPVLLEAIKEQQSQIELLEQRIAELE